MRPAVRTGNTYDMKAAASKSCFQKGLPLQLYLKQHLSNLPTLPSTLAQHCFSPSYTCLTREGKERVNQEDKLLKKQLCIFSEGPAYYVTGSWSASRGMEVLEVSLCFVCLELQATLFQLASTAHANSVMYGEYLLSFWGGLELH